MDPRLAPLASALRMNTRLFRSCLDGLNDEQARSRISERTNSVSFIAAHLVESRHFLASQLGEKAPSPFGAVFAEAKSIDDVSELPSLAAILEGWNAISEELERRLERAEASALDAHSPIRFPIDDTSRLGTVAFLMQHDSYHVGQLALLRKHVGFPAMKYT
jgi:uncharacterized damage-inducible protein DinB